MNTYIGYFKHHATDSEGVLNFEAKNKVDAIKQGKDFVEDGYRGQTRLIIDFGDETGVEIFNVRGHAYAWHGKFFAWGFERNHGRD